MRDHNGRTGDSEDILRTYLNEISRTPLLSREEEIELGEQAQLGDEEAHNRLVKANLRFVVSIAKKYIASGVPLLDLINEGNIGLIEAARRFDPQKANRFITYAKWWIQQAIRSAVFAQTGIVRLPAKQRLRLSAIDRAYEKLRNEHDGPPLIREVADEVGLSETEVEALQRASSTAISIASDGDRGAEILGGRTEESGEFGETDIERLLMLKSLRDHVSDMMELLNAQEKEMMTLRFGLNDDVKRSLESVGRKMGLSRERVRQIEKAAMRKIRGSAKTKELAVALN